MSDIEQFKSKFRRLAELREKKDQAEAAKKKANAAFTAAMIELHQEVTDAGIKGSLTFDFGPPLGKIRFTPNGTIYGKIIDARAALEALKAEGIEDAHRIPKFDEKRINELVRDFLERKQPLPDGVDFNERKYVTISRLPE